MPNNSATIQLNTANFGKMDKLIYASNFLHQRLSNIIQMRNVKGFDNPYPSICEIAVTHLLVVHNTFKPFAITIFEYLSQCAKCKELGGKIDFDLKFNCDFINDTYYEITLPQVQCGTASLPDIIVEPFDVDVLNSNGGFPINFGQARRATVSEPANVYNGFNYLVNALGVATPSVVNYNGTQYTIEDAATSQYGVGGISYVYTDKWGTFIAGPNGVAEAPDANGFGDPQSTGSQVLRANYVKAAELLGIKLIKENCFIIDQNEVTKYTSDYVVNYRERFLSKNSSRDQFDRLIGQEVPRDHIKDKSTILNTNAPGIGLDMEYTGYSSREYLKVADGLQTPKPFHDETKLLIPCHHWYSCLRKDALAVLCLPESDIRQELRTSPLDELYYPTPGDTYIQETVRLVPASGNDGSLVDPVVNFQRRIPFLIPGSVLDEKCCSRPINANAVICNIYMDDVVHTILLNRISFCLIRIVRVSCVKINAGDLEVEVNNAKWPCEYAFVRDIPNKNIVEKENKMVNPNVAETWWRCGNISYVEDLAEYHSHTFPKINSTNDGYLYHKDIVKQQPTKLRVTTDAITHFGVNIFDSDFYDLKERLFYSDYLPYAYCNGYILGNDSDSRGFFFTFSNIPGCQNPTGHYNISKTREMRYKVETNMPSQGCINVCTVLICINFIIISDGTLIIRFL